MNILNAEEKYFYKCGGKKLNIFLDNSEHIAYNYICNRNT